ncbi:hypothetical protein [Roseomonas xinghualingensis]|uniref:hypothetical protein n=1 Tax=Roseomonas xinghualingensis TaxID=2986475 RepID=UPI0036724ED5
MTPDPGRPAQGEEDVMEKSERPDGVSFKRALAELEEAIDSCEATADRIAGNLDKALASLERIAQRTTHPAPTGQAALAARESK